MAGDNPLKRVAESARAAGRGLGWSTLGLFAGHVIGLFVPDSFVPDATLGYMGSALLFGLYSVGTLNKFRTDRGRALSEALRDIDRMFADGTITDTERTAMRQLTITQYSPKKITRKRPAG
jgi:hypothetical protein